MARIALSFGIALASLGVVLITLFSLSGADFDDDGTLREPFYLLGIGAPALYLGLVLVFGVAAARFVSWLIGTRKQ